MKEYWVNRTKEDIYRFKYPGLYSRNNPDSERHAEAAIEAMTTINHPHTARPHITRRQLSQVTAILAMAARRLWGWENLESPRRRVKHDCEQWIKDHAPLHGAPIAGINAMAAISAGNTYLIQACATEQWELSDVMRAWVGNLAIARYTAMLDNAVERIIELEMALEHAGGMHSGPHGDDLINPN